MLKNLLISIVIIALLGGAAAYFFYQRISNPVEVDSGTAIVEINDTVLNVELAKTQQEWAQGLSDRPSMAENEGMLFINEQLILPGFWMKGMEFDLDMIWIRNGKIVGITENVPAPNEENETLQTYNPPTAVNMVLEVNAGWSEKNGIEEGDVVKVTETKTKGE